MKGFVYDLLCPNCLLYINVFEQLFFDIIAFWGFNKSGNNYKKCYKFHI